MNICFYCVEKKLIRFSLLLPRYKLIQLTIDANFFCRHRPVNKKVQDEVKQFMARFVKDNVYESALREIFSTEPVQAFIQNKSKAQQTVLKEHVG